VAYCRRCGTQLREGATFCHNCGTQIATIITQTPPPTPSPVNQTYQTPPPQTPSTSSQPPSTATSSSRKDSWVLIVIGLVVVLVLAVTIVAFFMVPLDYWGFASNSYGSNVSKLDFNFEANINQIVSTSQNIGLFGAIENTQSQVLDFLAVMRL
jgi:hypothetical protein